MVEFGLTSRTSYLPIPGLKEKALAPFQEIYGKQVLSDIVYALRHTPAFF